MAEHGATSFDTTHQRFSDEPPNADRVPIPDLDGSLSISEADLAWAAEDYGRVVHDRPLAVLHARSTHDIASIVRFAAEYDLPLVPRAQGHSTGGQAQAPGGIVLDMRHLNSIQEPTSDRVAVQAGARWSEVLTATLAHGLTPPVLTDYLELSIGGTLSVGGLGGASHQYGAQTDNVLDLDVVTSDGALVTCSPTRNSALFNAVRAGRGRCGVIVGATLRLIPAHTHARIYRLLYPSAPALMADQTCLAVERRFDYLEGQLKPDGNGSWLYQLEASRFFTPPTEPTDEALLDGLRHIPGTAGIATTTYWDFANRLEPDAALLTELGHWQRPHPWANLLLPDHSAEPIVVEMLAEVGTDGLGEAGLVLLYPVVRDRLATPKLRLPGSPTIFLFALLRTAPPGALEAMVEHNVHVQDRVRAAGGTLYLDHHITTNYADDGIRSDS